MNRSDLQQRVRRAVEALILAGQRYEGLLPSVLDRSTGDMPADLPPAIEGQRDHDRAFPGSNLLHDVDLLEVIGALGERGDEPYRAAADRYLQRFATHCTDTPTGLFPWGEHAFWDLRQDRIGNSYLIRGRQAIELVIHDHLREAPVWLWETLCEFNPRCVERFAEGLDHHWKGGRARPTEYLRHAFVELHAYPGYASPSSCDFPRHSGFYIVDWAFAYRRFGRAPFLEQLERMHEYWWSRVDRRGLLPTESRSTSGRFEGGLSVTQTLSLAVSLLHAAPCLDEAAPEMAARLRHSAQVYLDGCLNAPHAPDAGRYASLFHRATSRIMQAMPLWASRYGQPAAAPAGVMLLDAYEQTGERRALDLAGAMGRAYLEAPVPEQPGICARDAAEMLNLQVGLRRHDAAPDRAARIDEMIGVIVDRYFSDAALPRGATGVDWYEGQLGSSALVAALARWAFDVAGPGITP